jgi:hypothetical protein
MLLRILAGLLTLTLLHAPLAAADEAIRFSTDDGNKRAELKLNGNMECILENDRISCVPASK